MQDRPTKVSVSPPEPLAPTLVKSPPGQKRAAQAVTETRQAKLYLVSGMVQGVGYRYFAQRIAAQLGISGYAKNLSDGRVEIYAIAQPEALKSFSKSLEQGPKFAEVTSVEAQDRPIVQRYAESFSIEHDW
jgi:acylphosphatase